jgi:hypothetical protein
MAGNIETPCSSPSKYEMKRMKIRYSKSRQVPELLKEMIGRISGLA